MCRSTVGRRLGSIGILVSMGIMNALGFAGLKSSPADFPRLEAGLAASVASEPPENEGNFLGLNSLFDTAKVLYAKSLETIGLGQAASPGNPPGHGDNPEPPIHPEPDDHPGPNDHPGPGGCRPVNPSPGCPVSPTK